MREFTESDYDRPEIQGIRDFLKLVKEGEPWKISTEHLIRLHGNVKRGKYVNQSINEALEEFGLICNPEIQNADYYGHVIVSDPRDQYESHVSMSALPLSSFQSEIGDLIYCGPQMPLNKIKTLMIGYDISQIPVLQSKQTALAGVVTWKSIAQRGAEVDSPTAADVMSRPGHVAHSGDDFLDLVQTIIDQEYVLYRVPSGEISGIITASDLAQAFNNSTSIYIKLQELESRLRILLDRSPLPALEKHLSQRPAKGKVFRGARDMTFGDYISALKDDAIWKNSRILFDRETCISILDDVRRVRNKAMHFATGRQGGDGLTDAEASAVTKGLRIMRAVLL